VASGLLFSLRREPEKQPALEKAVALRFLQGERPTMQMDRIAIRLSAEVWTAVAPEDRHYAGQRSERDEVVCARDKAST
jgi:hypothetical protein